MFPIPLATSTTPLTSQQFWESVLIYFERPHLVNRKLLTAIPCLFYEIELYKSSISEIFRKSALLYESRQLKNIHREFVNEQLLRNLIDPFDKNAELSESSLDDFKARSGGIFVAVRILLGKQSNFESLEVVVLNKNDNSAFFLAAIEPSLKNTQMCAPPFEYTLKLDNDGFKLILNNVEDADTPQAEWLADKLFPKLLNWTQGGENQSFSIRSLSQIDASDYFTTYVALKNKYGADLVAKWPSGTDPQKYVFEDIAIASYLIVLFRKYSPLNVKFVDCGCGNGLLVYLLNSEGFNGFGMDIRRRKVWDIYGKLSENLHEGLIDSQSVFPDCNWLIGNHSDELTPWLPIIARKSGPCNFFLLPCCPFDLNGKKYVRKNTAISAYSDYLNHIENLSRNCGFDVFVDKLRIPSTKRTCLIGIDNLNSNCTDILGDLLKDTQIDFKYRKNQEKVGNCTQLNRQFLNSFIKSIVNFLLSTNPTYLNKKGADGTWNRGGEIPLSELPSKLDQFDLKQLKNECGGLKTLLKNHRYLFELDKGSVKLRLPLERNKETEKYRNKPCWYFLNHPDGCLFADDLNCAYKH